MIIVSYTLENQTEVATSFYAPIPVHIKEVKIDKDADGDINVNIVMVPIAEGGVHDNPDKCP